MNAELLAPVSPCAGSALVLRAEEAGQRAEQCAQWPPLATCSPASSTRVLHHALPSGSASVMQPSLATSL